MLCLSDFVRCRKRNYNQIRGSVISALENCRKMKFRASSQVKSWDKRVQTPGLSPPRAGAWIYYLLTPI